MANGSCTGHRGVVRGQTEPSRTSERVEDMPMNHYVHRIPQCQECSGSCRQVRELLECQTRLLGEILAVLDEMVEKQDT